MHEIMAADEQFYRGERPPRPGLMEGPGRHGPVQEPGPGGELRLEDVAAPPTDGEGPDVEVGPGRQGPHSPQAELSHPRARPQQGRGVQGDPQAPGRRCTGSRRSRPHVGTDAGPGRRS